MPEKRLWEAAHPYYAMTGNYYRGGNECHTEYESWAEFFEAEGDSDPDLNLVYRWDWSVPDPDDYADGELMPPEEFSVFWVGQRKALLRSTSFPVAREDEPAVRAWLTDRAKTMAAIWAPILVTGERGQ